ncbi:protein TIFY 9-like [Aristolochia californica]|uniref:protein TIFY 9-like n=1 Tax=Aristolochia californica TaxID=171875 RepID=UPI0035DA3DEB
MSRAAVVELDFFGMEKQKSVKSCEKPLGRNVRGIQNAMARIDPQVLRNVFANGRLDRKSGESNSYSPKNDGFFGPATRHSAAGMQSSHGNMMLPSSVSLPHRPVTENLIGTAPLTIFYNGTVAVFDVSPHMADKIMKLAETGVARTSFSETRFAAPPATERHQLLEDLNCGGLPIARKHSLQRFLEKRKKRLTCLSPYAISSTHADKKSVGSQGH